MPPPGDPTLSDPKEDGSPAHPFDSIQEAVSASGKGDLIIVRDGLYTGVGNRDITIYAEVIHLRSENGPGSCVIDCDSGDGPHRAFYLGDDKDEPSIVEGFTIINGSAQDTYSMYPWGGAIRCRDSNAVIRNNIIRNCHAEAGGGAVYVKYGEPTIIDNLILDNNADQDGAGLYLESSGAAISNNVIVGNICDRYGGGLYTTSLSGINNIVADNSAGYGGGMYTERGSKSLLNYTISGNTATEEGGGIYFRRDSRATIGNTIIWGNTAPAGPQVAAWYESAPTFVFSCVEGGQAAMYLQENSTVTWDPSSFDADPLFADPDNGDYHLKSQDGRWDPNAGEGAGGWVADTVTSPCINTGDPTDDFANEPEPNGMRINMGAYGNTAEASKGGVLPSTRILTVQSTPITSVNITGDKPGTTDYTATSDYQGTVILKAPEVVTEPEGIRYDFVRWEGYPDGQATIEIVMYDDLSFSAVYELRTHTLTVESTVTGANIIGDKPGVTNYTASCDDQEVVYLRAPPTLTSGPSHYNFERWVVGGVDQPAEQTQVQIIVNADITATAVYTLAVSTMYIEGPNERGEGPVSGGPDELVLFFVDIYAENMYGFAGFQATLEFLDDALVDAAGSTVFIAYKHLVPEGGAPWGDRQITWNQTFLPEIMEIVSGDTFGLLSEEREWIPFPTCEWGDYVDKTITDKTWLMTVGYWYSPGAEGTYTIGADPLRTAFGDGDAQPIPYTVVAGSVTIGWPVTSTRTLTVQSAPLTGVSITGDKPGTTNYTATCNDQEVVSLTAPPTVTDGLVRYDFVRWDGYADGQATIEITMDADVTVSAFYEIQTHTLAVESAPITGVNITGDKPGSTNYTATCDDQEVVNLTPPSTVTDGAVRYDFVRWSGYPDGQATIGITMNADRTATAVYEIQTHTLAVESAPITGVSITGSKPGVTNYTATCDDQEVVNLTAPPTLTAESVPYSFVRWDAYPDGQATIEITMDADQTATAVYVAAPQRLIIEGPDQRGEEPAMMGEGTVTVDVYAEGITGFAAVQAVLEFTDPLGADDGFLIRTTDGNPEFGGQAIVYNEALFGSIFPIFIGDAGRPFHRETAGFMMMSGNADLPGKTWLMSITYDCNVGYDTVGTHTITANELVTVLAGTGGGIPHDVVPGSATFVKWPIPGDANLDCMINVIDMLVIRDKLNADVSSGDNWRADVNEDGVIDILDLIFVRGKLHDMCAEFACVTTQLNDFTISSNPVSIMIGDSRSVIDHGDTVDVYLDGALLRGRVPVAPLTPITGVEMPPGEHTLRIDYASGGADKCIEAIIMIIPADALAVTEIQEITIGAGGSSACTIRRE